MRVTRFDPDGELIIVPARVWGPNGHRKIGLAVDTATTETMVLPEVLDWLGYSPRQGEARTVIRSAVADEPGYLIRVSRFQALGFQEAGYRLHAHDLPEGFGIDGLLGLSFLRRLRYAVRSDEGRILAERIGGA